MATTPVSPVESTTQTSAHSLCSRQLFDCLANKKVPFIQENDPTWDTHTRSFNARLSYRPCVVIIPKNTQHVSDAIICASKHGIHVQAKCGGHSYANFSNGGTDGAMIINMRNFRDVVVDQETGVAKVGGGKRLGPLGLAIWNQGKRALAHGTCSAVGIGGHYTHGGYGHFSRAWGLAMDQIVALDVVLADGSLVHANGQQHADVFYAMRGAADMIGIAVNFYLQTRRAPENVIKWDLDLSTSAPINNIETATDIFLHLQAVAQNPDVVDKNISFGLVLGPGQWFNVGGIYLGSLDHFNDVIAPELLHRIPGTKEIKIRELNWIETLKHLGGDDLTVADPYTEQSNFYAKSVIVPQPGASRESVRGYMNFIAAAGQKQDFGWYAILDLYGGSGSQINTKDIDFAAYRDRSSMWVAQHQAYVRNDATFPKEGVTFLNDLNKALTHRLDSFGAYLPYVDSEYDKDMARRMYYGEEVHARLKTIKRAVDPKNVFANPQSIDP
ncbi:hypothetical protein SUNI508_01093 [Seiridium unicorne]|uniref:FAD-binding PCMH-type domain-containing protein n=1 Tax=Seiridium unicorne TaxID=138068 RepID=A0ABR2UX13_9PEZI